MIGRFYATIEYLAGQCAAIVELTDAAGEWQGGGRIELRPRACESVAELRARLYEAGYADASARAAGKGGRLERFREAPGASEPRRAPERQSAGSAARQACRFRVRPATFHEPRPNALRIEVLPLDLPRCTLKLPAHWPAGSGRSALRWLGSGGSPAVLGVCSHRCPNAGHGSEHEEN